MACVGLALGIPIGAAAGRLAWWAVAQPHGVATDASIPVAAMAVVVPVAVAVGAGIGWLAARHMLRRPPAAVLRTE